MGQVDPRFSFEFDVIEKGTYRVKVKETNVELEGVGKESGKRYWARLVVVGGDQEGLSHMESFFEKTKNDFSFSKMAGFLYKLGVIKTLGKVDTSMFTSPEFEERWKKQLVDKMMGIKIGHKTKDKDGREMDRPQSKVDVYYSIDEVTAILSKGPKSSTPKPPETPAPEAAKAVPNMLWD